MTEKHSENFNTDNEESEVISVKQTIEANGETIVKGETLMKPRMLVSRGSGGEDISFLPTIAVMLEFKQSCFYERLKVILVGD